MTGLELNPYKSVDATTEVSSANARRRLSSLVFFLLSTIFGSISIAGFIVPEYLDESGSALWIWVAIYGLSLAVGAVGSSILVVVADSRGKRIAALLAIFVNVVSALLTLFLLFLFSVPFSTG